MAWAALCFAGLFEIVWVVGMKYIDGFTRLWSTIGTFAAMAVSVLLLGFAIKTLPLGTAYAVWTGIGTAGTVIVGMILFYEPASALRLGAIGLILIGGVGLKLLGS
jgi:quaternary ammonium compound-resistance protein SugE